LKSVLFPLCLRWGNSQAVDLKLLTNLVNRPVDPHGEYLKSECKGKGKEPLFTYPHTSSILAEGIEWEGQVDHCF